MTVLVVALTAAVALLGVLVLGLLRSHAEILRQLHALGAGREDTAAGAGREDTAAGAGREDTAAGAGRDDTASAADRDAVRGGRAVVPAQIGTSSSPFDVSDGVVEPAGVTGNRAVDVSGVTPDDETVLVGVVGVGHDTLLAFLSSGCSTCEGFWDVFADPAGVGLPEGVRLVVVTQSAGLESESAVRAVAPRGIPVVMSTAAWEEYGVPGSPYFVLVDGAAGRIAGEGSATAWQQVVRLVGEATADREIAVRRHRSGEDRVRGGAHREARADRELAAAGILPGHPSLLATADELSDEPGDER